MRLKPGAKLKGIKPEIVLALLIIEPLLTRKTGAALVITSGTDGKHSAHSHHYTGNAVDIRTRDIEPALRRSLAEEIHDALGDEFDVVLESDHLHVEFDPS